MKVQATRVGYYGEKLRQVGEIFHVAKDEDFADDWMEKSDASAEEMEASIHHYRPATNQTPTDPRDLDAIVKEVLGNKSIAAHGGVDGRVPPAGFKAKGKEEAKPAAPDFDLKNAKAPEHEAAAEAPKADAAKAKSVI